MAQSDRLPSEPIALGRTAEIYTWKDGWVLKLFHDWVPNDDAEYEARTARVVSTTGLRVPEVGEIVEVNGRLGLEYERLDGISLAEEMRARPWALGGQARLLARLQAEMHAINGVSGLPSLKDRLERRIHRAELSSEVREACLSTLAQMPDGQALCHGDFHPGNILLTEKGPVVIDWIDAAVGSPLADVARTTVLALGQKAAAPNVSVVEKAILGWAHSLYLKRYLKLYLKVLPGGEAEYRAWVPLVAAARLTEGIEKLAPWLKSQAAKVLET